jgi:hypothetical protein
MPSQKEVEKIFENILTAGSEGKGAKSLRKRSQRSQRPLEMKSTSMVKSHPKIPLSLLRASESWKLTFSNKRRILLAMNQRFVFIS